MIIRLNIRLAQLTHWPRRPATGAGAGAGGAAGGAAGAGAGEVVAVAAGAVPAAATSPGWAVPCPVAELATYTALLVPLTQLSLRKTSSQLFYNQVSVTFSQTRSASNSVPSGSW